MESFHITVAETVGAVAEVPVETTMVGNRHTHAEEILKQQG